ncbi:hypothetical protein NB311A_00060 [Nitrobacter sp. Nb-311A]|nr:hypothetical protein NB311A_00060 [Nitrobacter sp. Nb-311A]
MARGAAVDRRLAWSAGLAEVSVDRDVWRDLPVPQVVHELLDVIGLVRTERDPPPSATPAIDQTQRCLSLGGAGRLGSRNQQMEAAL